MTPQTEECFCSSTKTRVCHWKKIISISLFPLLPVFNEVASHNRMKLCEAIIRSCHQCGEMLPVYKEVIMSALICGVKDDDELIRASSLSGIGDLCRLLSYSVASIIIEVTFRFV